MDRPDEVITANAPAVDAANEAATAPAGSSAAASSTAPLLMGVKLPIRILVGRAQMPLSDIVRLGSGSVVELECSPNDPVEIIVNDRVIASGEIVVVGGNYGVRITKIASRGQTPGQGEAAMDLQAFSERLK